MATSLIRGRYVICEAGTGESQSRVITDGAVLQRDGVIEAVGAYDELRHRQVDEVVGGPGFLVMPGMTNAHHHGRGVSTFQFGTVDGCLESWIVEGWGRRPVDWHLITAYTAIQMLKSGHHQRDVQPPPHAHQRHGRGIRTGFTRIRRCRNAHRVLGLLPRPEPGCVPRRRLLSLELACRSGRGRSRVLGRYGHLGGRIFFVL